jgi:hypothetical protein
MEGKSKLLRRSMGPNETLNEFPANKRKLKRHRAAALHNLAEEAACWYSRQRRGVRQPYAAFAAPFIGHMSR